MLLPAWMLCLTAPIIGSFLGVFILRWPDGRPVVIARSACETCGHTLGAADLVPLFSFVFLRGRCRYCGASIGWFHPAIELAALTIAAAAFYADGGGVSSLIDAALGWCLLCAAWIDAKTFRLPDVLTLPLILAGLGVTWIYEPAALYNHAAAAALGYLSFRIINALYRAVRHRDGLGQGDAKLLGAAGAWLGIAALPYVIVVAGATGIGLAVLSQREAGLRRAQPIAFGPALAWAFFLWRLFGRYAAAPS
jgi:leader peptidase (prepilin peptidase)/N-methyltransferase